MSDGVHLLNRPTELTSRYLVESASLPGIGYVVIVVGTTAACPCLAFKYRARCPTHRRSPCPPGREPSGVGVSAYQTP